MFERYNARYAATHPLKKPLGVVLGTGFTRLMDAKIFIDKWSRAELKERSASQEHFLDLCELLGEKKPAEADPTGETYAFEKGAIKTTGASGWADVWKQGCFGWEYKGPGKDLDKAFSQLLTYSVALENPPLLIVSDLKRIIIRTNWTNTVQKTWEFSLEDLTDGAKRQILKDAFSNPEALKPAKTRQELTEDAAREFAEIAKALRDRGHDPEEVAHFVNRMVFCMFAEDVHLLPDNIFTEMLRRGLEEPDEFVSYAETLFGAMRGKNGRVGFTRIEWFNGGLFDDNRALELTRDEIKKALTAAELYWGDIDPSILGTLFERGLDPDKRSQLGAHYTDRDKIMMIIGPVIIEPLKAEWQATHDEIRLILEKRHVELEKIAALRAGASKVDLDVAKAGEKLRRDEVTKLRAAETRLYNQAVRKINGFRTRLNKFRVLDPACGSGNFLNLALLALKDIEHKANLDVEALGLPRKPPQVGPECLKGIEINPYAAELARVSIWIGEIQWMRRNGFSASRNPVLRPLDAIECADALVEQHPVTGVWREKAWPQADVIVGNPPFLGSRKMRPELGGEYVDIIRRIFRNRVGDGADLVTYWFWKSQVGMDTTRLARFGLVATNSVAGGASRSVLKPLFEKFFPIAIYRDEPWTVDGAAVRVALITFSKSPTTSGPMLDGREVSEIYSDLTGRTEGRGTDITKSRALRENESRAFQGVVPRSNINNKEANALGLPPADFAMDRTRAEKLLKMPLNPNGRPNADVVKPYHIGIDVVRRPLDRFIVDFDSITESDAALYEGAYAHIQPVKAHRAAMSQPEALTAWWQHWRPRAEMKSALAGFNRFVATPRVSKHRVFVWLKHPTIVDNALIAIARDDDTTFGILHSRFHELWSLRMGTSLEDRPRYTPTTTFETFPFPEGLTPDIPASDYADDPRAIAIAEAAARLNELRENWLNPADLVRREPEVVPGYPDRILPVDEAAAKELKKRTLTNLYNARPAWLDHAHKALDSAVAAAYGWPDGLSEDEILARLFALNQERAKAQEKAAN